MTVSLNSSRRRKTSSSLTLSHSFTLAVLVTLSALSTTTLATSPHSSAPTRYKTEVKTFNPKVPLFQRGSYFARLRQDDGVVDLDSLRSQITVARNKMQSGAYKYLRRKHHRLKGFQIGSATEHFFDSVWNKISNANDDRKLNLKRQQNPLTNYNDGSLWAGRVSVGTPPQEFTVCFDTGSADMWVADKSTSTDSGLETYNVNASSTAKPTDDRFGILYGDGSSVNGPLYQDTVEVAGLKAEGAYVAAATTVSPQFYNGAIDGILGMAYPSISNTGEKGVFQSLYEQGLLDGNLFSFELGDSDEGELYLGGSDSSRYEGSINYAPVTQEAYWTIQGSVGVDGKVSNKDKSMIIDTGTTLVILPPNEAETLYANVPTAKPWKNSFYIYDCSIKWTAQFTFNGQGYTIPSEYLNLGLTEAGSKYCVSGIASQDMGLGDTFLVGGVFLRTVYSVFNFDKNAVGFAPLKGKKYQAGVPASIASSSSSTSSTASSTIVAVSTTPSSTPSQTPSASGYATGAPSATSTSTRSKSKPSRSRGPSRSSKSYPWASSASATSTGGLVSSLL